MIRSKPFLILLILLSILSCTKDQTVDPNIAKSDAIKSSEWVTSGFSTIDNTPIDPALFSGDAKFINQLTYRFQDAGIVRSYDKVSKQAQAYGTWALVESATKLEINIQGFKGTLGVIELSKTKMTLRNNITYKNTNIPINIIFIPLQ